MSSTQTSTRPTTHHTSTPSKPPPKRKKDYKDASTPRPEIWTNLLRQTRAAQARSRTQAIQPRHLLLCGGSPDDQRSFVTRYLARPPPAQAPGPGGARGKGERELRRQRGEVKLSNLFAYGYGFVSLFSPPSVQGLGAGGGGGGGGGAGLLGAEAEEVAKVEVHTVPEAEVGYEETLRGLLRVRKTGRDDGEVEVPEGEGEDEGEGRRPAVCILLSWKEPWLFLSQLRRWLHLLSRSLLPSTAPKDENPLEVIKEHALSLTVVLQHVEAQESLERENFTEETFDYISQTLRTCLLPLSAGLVYTASASPPQQPGAPLSEIQKVLYTSLGLDVSALQAKGGKKEEVQPRHNVVDRMAIVVPAGWDSVGKIRLLSETFTPEAVTEGWVADLGVPVFAEPSVASHEADKAITEPSAGDDEDSTQADAGAEVYELTATATATQASPLAHSPQQPSPSKLPRSALTTYESSIQDPHAHKAHKAPTVDVHTKPEQDFLAEMRAALQGYEAQDAERKKSNPGLVSTTAGALAGARGGNDAGSGGGAGGGGPGGALSDLGDVAFNVGGVSYNTVSAEAAIERLKRPQQQQQQLSSSSGGGAESPTPVVATTPRSGTPRPPRREAGDGSGESAGAAGAGKETSTPSTVGGGKGEMDKLEEYFHSLMKRGGGGSSASSTPSKGS